MDNLEIAKSLFLEGLQHHNNHRLAEAEALYRRAHALVPDRVSILSNLAVVLAAQRRHAEAREFCERALAIEPDQVDTQMTLACCLRELADPAAALGLLKHLTALRPDDPDGHNTMGIVLSDLGREQDALACYDRSLALRPEQVGVLVNRAVTLRKLERPTQAFASLKRALAIDPQSSQARSGFVNLACAFDIVVAGDSEFEALAVRAISEPWCRPQAMAPVLIRLLWSDPDFRSWLDKAAAIWPQRVSLDGFPWPRVFSNRTLVALLENAPATNLSLEMLLTAFRWRLLRDAMDPDGEPDPQRLAFHCTLARQCFINEYVYDQDDRESDDAVALKAKFEAALATGQPFPIAWLPALASYWPLWSLPMAERLLDKQWPDAIAALLEQQVREPLAERQARASIPCLTGIDDQVSQQVRQQYEENPYPRWVASARPPERQSIDSYLLRRFPRSAYRSLQPRPIVSALNAGCGTGQHPIETAQRFSGIQLLAVDLSLASLAFATRMAKRAGVENIRFAQADIVEIGALDQRFDFIESDGVIHHMRDPAHALAQLCSLLAPEGVMKLALYSEQARQAVVAVRSLIAKDGYATDDRGIRSCRRRIIGLDDGRIEKQVLDSADFYTLSECRDLLFHVQEHRFTIPQLRQLLADTGLEFIGFELTPRQIASFQEEFPEEASLYRLEAWHDHELRHPDTFAGMYQFWVQRATPQNS